MDAKMLLETHHCKRFASYFITTYVDAQCFSPDEWISGLPPARTNGRLSTRVVESIFGKVKREHEYLASVSGRRRLDRSFADMRQTLDDWEGLCHQHAGDNAYQAKFVANLLWHLAAKKLGTRKSLCFEVVDGRGDAACDTRGTLKFIIRGGIKPARQCSFHSKHGYFEGLHSVTERPLKKETDV